MKVMEVAIAISDALQHLNGVVHTPHKAIGIREIKGIENKRLPVLKHGAYGSKLGGIRDKGKSTQGAQAFLGLIGSTSRIRLFKSHSSQV